MRSIWKGHIRFSLVTIPIQIFNAIEYKGNIKFKQLHRSDNGPVGYDKVCRSCDEKVPKEDIVKGYEYEPDQFVIIEAEDLSKIKLKSTRAIDIEAFVDMNEVHPSRYEAVYYVGPNGDVAVKTYSLFCETLKKSKKAGVGRIILRDREDVILLKPYKNGLVLYKLRYPYALTTKFEDVDFEDRYRDALIDLVNSKVEGKEIVSISDAEETTPVVDIMSALKESIEKAKKSKKSA